MKIKYFINLNEGLEDGEENPDWKEISHLETKPKSRTAHVTLMKKYGATKAQENAYRAKVGLAQV